LSYLEEGLKNSEVLKLDRIVKNIAVIGAGIVGICSAYFLKKSGFNVTLIDKEKPGTMTSFGHACSFADYANVPVNYPGLIWDIPSMLLRKDGPLAIDLFYILKNLPWAISFLKNCNKEKVNEIASSLTNLLKHSQISYDEIFQDVDVSEYISHEENLYLFDSKKSFEDNEYANVIRKNNNVKVRNLNKNEVKEIAEIMLQEVFVRLQDKGIKLNVTDAFKERLVEEGYNPSYGARPLRRAVMRLLEDSLAEEVLSGRIKDGDNALVDIDDTKKVTINISSEESSQELAGANF